MKIIDCRIIITGGITDLDPSVYLKRTIYEILLLLLYNLSFNYSLSSYNNTSLSTLDFEKYSNERL